MFAYQRPELVMVTLTPHVTMLWGGWKTYEGITGGSYKLLSFSLLNLLHTLVNNASIKKKEKKEENKTRSVLRLGS